jgi:hypothetical protein
MVFEPAKLKFMTCTGYDELVHVFVCFGFAHRDFVELLLRERLI